MNKEGIQAAIHRRIAPLFSKREQGLLMNEVRAVLDEFAGSDAMLPSPGEPSIRACAAMIKGACMTRPQAAWNARGLALQAGPLQHSVARQTAARGFE